MAETQAAAAPAAPPPAPDAKPADLAATANGDTSPANSDAEKIPEPKKHTPNPRVREFAALTRKEREVRGMLAQQKNDAAQIAEFKALAANAKNNPDAVLKMLGLTYDDVTNHYVKGGGDSPDTKARVLEQRLAATEERLEQTRRQLEEREQSKVVADFVGEIKKVVDTNDEFELVRAYEAYDDVYQLIDLHYQKTGEILDKAEAAERIERVLFQSKEAEAQKLLGLKKLKQKLRLRDADDSQESDAKQIPTASDATKTITQELTAATMTSKPTRPLTEREEWAALKARTRAALKQAAK